MGKFIHTADIHLDSPLKGLERYEGAPKHIRNVTRQAFDNLIELALKEEVDFLLIAGDLYDGDWRDYSTGLYFASQMNRLREAGIPVYVVRGNHDAASQITRHLTLADNVRIFSYEEPETVTIEHLGIAIHGQSFATRAVTDNLAKAYPNPIQGFTNIGMLHTAIDGREGHEPYAPCSLDELINKGYDYWALGHVHKQEQVYKRAPWIIYPGNIQGRHINESGAKGCTLVSLEDGKIDNIKHYDLDVLRWCRCIVDCTAALSPVDMLDKIRIHVQQELEQAGGRYLVFRFELTGASAVHQALHRDLERWINEIRLVVQDEALDEGWLERVKVRTTSNSSFSSSTHLPRAFLHNYFAKIEQDEELIEEIKQEFQQLKAKLSNDLFMENSEINLDNLDALKEMLADVKNMVESRFGDGEVSANED